MVKSRDQRREELPCSSMVRLQELEVKEASGLEQLVHLQQEMS